MKMFSNSLKLKKEHLKTFFLFFLCLTTFLVATPVWAGLNQWTTTNGPYGGDFYDFAVSPNYDNDQTIFAVANQGVFRSTNGGNLWTKVDVQWANHIVISPKYSNDKTVFTSGDKIRKSTDGGTSWVDTTSPVTYSPAARAMVISPNFSNDQTIFVGTSSGVFKSTNGGASWTQLTTNGTYSLAISPDYLNDLTLFAQVSGTNAGIYKSIDGGVTWGLVKATTNQVRFVLSPNYANDHTIFASGTSDEGILKSTNSGTSWVNMSSGFLYNVPTAFAISPKYSSDQTIFAGTHQNGVYKSTNGGVSWTQINNGLPQSRVDALSISPNYSIDQNIFASLGVNGDGPGIFISTNGGAVWSAANNGLNIGRYISSIVISPNYADDQTVFAGTIGNDTYKSINDTNYWSMVGNAVGGELAISPDYAVDKTIFAASYNQYYIYKSTDGGITWIKSNTGISYVAFWNVAISPNYAIDQSVFAAGNSGVYKSNNKGSTWFAVNNGLTETAISGGLVISPNYSIDQTLFVGGNNRGVFKSINGGTSWINVSSGLPQTPGYIGPSIRSLVISPNYANDNTLFTIVSGRGIYGTTNGGASWTQIDYRGGSAIAISPQYALDHTVFVSRDGAVFRSNDGGVSWTQLSNIGLPSNTTLWVLAISPNYINDKTIFGGSMGIYMYTLYTGCTDNDNDGYSVEDGACGAIDCNDSNAAINPGAPDIICNGIDNNCNGIADEGYAASSTVCGYGACVDIGQLNCVNGQTQNTCTPGTPQVEVCNGVDDDCDGQTDDGIPNIVTGSDVGACQTEIQSCVNGAMTVIQPAIGPSAEICDGVDNDCNGLTDENIPNIISGTDIGACQTEIQSCVNGVMTIVQPAIVSSAEVCDLVDNDCDGLTDEDYPDLGSTCSVGIGACSASGTMVCNGAGNGTVCNAQPGTPSAEVCNGIDDNCDGQTDEGIPNIVTGSDVGACQTEVQSCMNGAMTVIQPELGPSAEICDGVDNDCNGQTDESIPNIVTGSDIGACQTEIQSCVSGSMTIVQPAIVPSAEVCDLVDNDCDGLSDEDYPDLGSTCSVGIGACLASGTMVCTGNGIGTFCDAQPGTPSAEVCNGIDDDCDSQADEGIPDVVTGSDVGTCQMEVQSCVSGVMTVIQSAIGPSTEVCDGIDNDCDDIVDEGVLTTYYQDADGDGYGNLNQSTQACTQPSGHVSDSTDCNDTVSGVNPGASDVLCDGVDNNCSGTFDDGYVPSTTVCGDGVCGAIGQLICVSGQTQNTCTPGLPTGADDNCNSIDEDCNGVADDGFVPTATSCGIGVCGSTGQLVCVSGQTQDTCSAGQPTGTDDNCNGLDEDCSGVADDSYVPTATSCGVGVCGSTGQLVCLSGQIQDTCTAGQPQTEGPVGDLSCNDTMDNDCDGNIDLSDPACINTPSGQDVTTQPVDETTGTTPVDVNFSDVDANGITTLTTSGVGAPPPLGFKIGTPPTYFEISTTASYSGQIEVCINYSAISYANESTLKLFHRNNNIWEDITSSLDTVNNIICGVTTSLSPFAIFEFYNKPPVAEAGADLSLACLETTCPVILDGSGSTDPNSTPGTQDDIASYEWYKNYGAVGEVLLAAGRTISYDLLLGVHQITLLVTDRAGVQEDDEIVVRVNPAQLSLLEITKAEVEWEKAGEKPNRVKIHGKVAMPAGKDYFQVNPAGNVTIGISSASNALNQNMAFQVKGDYGSKWEYKADPAGMGISKYEIDWQGAKFDYNREIRLKSNHLGSNSTTLEIDRKDIAEAIVISVNDITIHIDSTGAVSAIPESIKVDVDDDGEIEVELPFALAMNTSFSVTHGTTSYTLKVGDYYSAAVGKFELMGRFDPNGLNGTTRPATLDLGIKFGNQGFPGMFHILDGGWAQLKNVEWKYKK